VKRAVTLPDFERQIAGGDKWLDAMFRGFFVGPSVARAYEEAKGRS
jgi:hypothetical protein